MSDSNVSKSTAKQLQRLARQEEQLRANLRKRKALAKARAANAKEGASGPQTAPEDTAED